jgi:RHS repeat-associated protein
MVYNDAVQGLALSPYGMTDASRYQVQHLAGQKQYELTNHLGNVQATISDLPVKVGEAHTEYHAPALPAVYDYYPFGMLMPDRYTIDTSSECVTVSQTKWVTTWVTHCYTPTDWVWPGYTSWGSVSVSTSSGLQISAGENAGVQFDVEVLPFEQQDVYLQIEGFYSGSGTFELQEYHNGQWTVLGSASFDKIGEVHITCRPRQAMVRAILRGPYYILAKQLCVTKPVLSQETVLVDICDTDGDKYRFGFNGQEKVNEWAGIGNYLDFVERGYDSRIGRFLSVDPYTHRFPYLTPYQFASNSPIVAVDVDGLEGVKYTDVKRKQITVMVDMYYILETKEKKGSGMNQKEVDRTERNLNSELNKRKFKDNVTGYDVIFDVKFHKKENLDGEFFVDNDVQNKGMFLRKIKTQSSVTYKDGMRITATTEGNSRWRMINITDSRNGHNLAHELFHNLTHNHLNAPERIRNQIDPKSQTAGHNAAGGIFTYANNLEGKAEEDISQSNVQEVLLSVPEQRVKTEMKVPAISNKSALTGLR